MENPCSDPNQESASTLDRSLRSSQPVRQVSDLAYRMPPLVHRDQLVVTDARLHQMLEPGYLEMDQQRDGRLRRPLGREPSVEQLEALAELARHFEWHPGATLQERPSLTNLLHINHECKKMAKGADPAR
jgi:hypothetical protein